MEVSRRAFVVGAVAACASCRGGDDPAAVDDRGPAADEGAVRAGAPGGGGFGSTIDLGPVDGVAAAVMDRFELQIADGRLLVDTSVPLEGPAQGVRALPEEPAGRSCIWP